MRIVFGLLKEFIELKETPEEIARILTNLGLEVEDMINFKNQYQNFLIGQIAEAKIFDEQRNLFLCKVDFGSEYKTIVCGAPNTIEGSRVVVALPGAILPNSSLKIELRNFGKISSEGMICSEAELGIGSDSSGILILEDDIPLGLNFANYYGFDDIVFELGITPNRADCFSHIGVARELSAYLRRDLHLPRIEIQEDKADDVSNWITVEILDPELCPRYTARVVKGVSVKKSPKWLTSKLIMMGLRPINAIVDVTNYVMMELGQPLHAFDYDRLGGKKIVVRTAKDGENFVTLDGKQRELDKTMLMICDAEKPVAIGGVMGGENSEISSNTRNVLLESAYFLPSSIRRTAKKLGISSESSYRFERGVDIDNVTFALDRATDLISKLASGVVVNNRADEYPNRLPSKQVKLRFARASEIIGKEIEKQDAINILKSLRFRPFEEDDKSAVFEVPSHRVDISQEIDLIEEITRFVGYDNIPEDTKFNIAYEGEPIAKHLAVPPFRNELKQYLVARGFFELLTPNLSDPNKVKIFESGEFIELANPLGVELSVMRATIVPALLDVVGYNLRVGVKDIRAFEIGKIFKKSAKKTEFIEGIEEAEVLGIVLCGNAFPLQWGLPIRKVDYFDLKGIIEDSFANFGFRVEFERAESKFFAPESASIVISGKQIGEFGYVSKKILRHFDIDEDVLLALVNLEQFYKGEITTTQAKYRKVSQFPVVRRDLAFVVDESIQHKDIEEVIRNSGGEYLKELTLFDIYRGNKIEENKKSMAFALFFNSNERTLTEEEVEEWISRIVASVEKQLGGKLRSF